MTVVVSYCLTVLALLLAIPGAIFAIEVAAALLLPQQTIKRGKTERQNTAVLIPAHNEGPGILPTINDVMAQLITGDRLVVVADNCTDDTADVARQAGAEVLIRKDHLRKGKGYALEFGIAHLRSNPPHTIIVIDADCRVSTGAVSHLACACEVLGRPIQALYLMNAPADSAVNYRVAEFAWRVKNWARPLGLNALNLPCQLMGTGMALPWQLIRKTKIVGTSLAEDMRLGVDLAQAGAAPLFCSSALVTSQFPASYEGSKTQRQRWEAGHIHTMRTALPRLFGRSIASGNLFLMALALDLTIPPLSLLIILLAAMLAISGLAAFFSLAVAPLIVTATAFAVVATAVLAAWTKFGRDVLPLKSVFLVVAYAARKLPFYYQALTGKTVIQWIRTDREKSR